MTAIALLPGDGIGVEILDGPVAYPRQLARDGAPIEFTGPWGCIIHLIRNTFRFASKKYWGAIASDLKPVYTAASEPEKISAHFADVYGATVFKDTVPHHRQGAGGDGQLAGSPREHDGSCALETGGEHIRSHLRRPDRSDH